MTTHHDTNSESHSRGRDKVKGKQHSGGEPSKHAVKMHEDELEERQFEINVAEGADNKKGNIGPSGQGSHRGRESRNRQTNASGRPNVPSDTQKNMHH